MKIVLSLYDYDLLKEKSHLTAFGGSRLMQPLFHMPKSWIQKFDALNIHRTCYCDRNCAVVDIKYINENNS